MRALAVGLMLCCSCAFMKKLEPQLVSCEGQVGSQVGSLIPQVEADLQMPGGWAEALDVLLQAEGPAAACAVQAVIADLENRQSNAAQAGAPQVPELVQLIRAHAWQQSHGHRAQPGSKPWRSTSIRL